jgi:long-chain fatty acid transport protein
VVKNAKYDMSGDSWDFGYNLAVSVKPLPEATFAITYRSEIDMSLDGETKSFASIYSGSNGSVELPLPAVLSVAGAYTFNHATTIEFVYERNFWSAYDKLDFTFDNPAYNGSYEKNWDDSSVYRLGLTHVVNNWTLMAGYAYDETPIPDATVGYELPSSDANIFSLGAKYLVNAQWEVGLAGLMAMYDDREVNNTVLNGEFSNINSYLVSMNVEYKF